MSKAMKDALIERHDTGVFADNGEIISMLFELKQIIKDRGDFDLTYPIGEAISQIGGLYADYRQAIRLLKTPEYKKPRLRWLQWHPFNGTLEPILNERYLVMHYNNAPEDQINWEDYEISTMFCEQRAPGERLFNCTCGGEMIRQSEHVYFAEIPNLPKHIKD